MDDSRLTTPTAATTPTAWETEEILVSYEQIAAALASLRDMYGATDPEAEGPRLFALMGGGSRQPQVRVTRAILEGIFDWHRWPGMERCHCGDRAAELFWRLQAALTGERLPDWNSREADEMAVRYGG